MIDIRRRDRTVNVPLLPAQASSGSEAHGSEGVWDCHPALSRMVFRRRLALLIAVNTSAGILAAVLHVVFRKGDWTGFWILTQECMVYAWCIGTLCSLVMYYAAGRIWRLNPFWRYFGFALAFVALGIAGSFLACLILLRFGFLSLGEFWGEYMSGLRVGVVFTVLIGAAVTAFEVLFARLRAANEELQRRLLEEERARKLASEARLSSLESRIHPHFLFNTLNSISALVREDPAAAERTVERLAALLRYSLDAGGRQLTSLACELSIVRDYLEIEKTRFGERLRYHVDVPAQFDEVEVPPLSVQLLVENSVKHAMSRSRAGGEIDIAAHSEGGQLRIEVTDDGGGFDPSTLRLGHGLENLRERLSVLFNGEARLEFSRNEGRMAVEIRIPFTKVPA